MTDSIRPRLPKDFALDVAASLARIEERQRSTDIRIEEGQRSTNGTLVELREYQRIANGRTGTLEGRVDKLEKLQDQESGASGENARWKNMLRPAVLMLVCIFVGVILSNGPQIMQFVMKTMEGMVK